MKQYSLELKILAGMIAFLIFILLDIAVICINIKYDFGIIFCIIGGIISGLVPCPLFFKICNFLDGVD